MKRVLILALAALLAVAAPAWAQEDTGGEIRPTVGCSGTDCWPTYSYRDLDSDVIAIQYLLRQRGYANFEPNNGYFGTQTAGAVKAFQRAKGLRATGVVDGATWEALIVPKPFGARGDAVRAVQVELRDQYGYGLPVTGYYGTQTRAAVTDFQRKQGLAATGNANRPTWRALVSTR